MVCWGDFKGSCILLVLWLQCFSLLKDSDFIAIWVNIKVCVLVLGIMLLCIMFVLSQIHVLVTCGIIYAPA